MTNPLQSLKDFRSIKRDKGYGYVDEFDKICMERCFKCGMENWALAVPTGKCANGACGYDVNKVESK